MKSITMRLSNLAVALVLCLISLNSWSQGASYEFVPDWPQLPEEIVWGQVPNVSIDLDGNLYAFHRSDPPILKFNPQGELIGSWGADLIARPHGFRVAPDGSLWATDYDRAKGHHVVKYSTDGRVLLRLGARGFSGTGPNTFNGPTDVAVAENGDVFVADGHWNNRIVKFSSTGKYLMEWGKKGSGRGEFDLPHTIVIDKRGRVLVGDRSNHRIQIFDQEGNYLDEWSQFGWPSGIFIDRNDIIYVADYQDKKGITYGSAEDGTVMGFISGTEPEGVTVDAAGNVYSGEVVGGDGEIMKKFLKK